MAIYFFLSQGVDSEAKDVVHKGKTRKPFSAFSKQAPRIHLRDASLEPRFLARRPRFRQAPLGERSATGFLTEGASGA